MTRPLLVVCEYIPATANTTVGLNGGKLEIAEQFTIMVGESLTTRLARKRLAALKALIPLRDRFREKLQARQQMQTDFTVGSEQLFAPVTKATKDVTAATQQAIYGDIPKEGERKRAPLLPVLAKIAAETEQTQKGIKQLSSDIKTQRKYERLADIDDSNPVVEQGDVGEIKNNFYSRKSFLYG